MTCAGSACRNRCGFWKRRAYRVRGPVTVAGPSPHPLSQRERGGTASLSPIRGRDGRALFARGPGVRLRRGCARWFDSRSRDPWTASPMASQRRGAAIARSGTAPCTHIVMPVNCGAGELRGRKTCNIAAVMKRMDFLASVVSGIASLTRAMADGQTRMVGRVLASGMWRCPILTAWPERRATTATAAPCPDRAALPVAARMSISAKNKP